MIAFACNALFVGVTTAALLILGERILLVWVGATIAQAAAPILSLVTWSSALLGLNVTATYALLALGRVRTVTWFNMAGGAVMLLTMLLLTPRLGVLGIAIARLSYAVIPLLLYIPLLRLLRQHSSSTRTALLLEPVGDEQ
jgi:O-antigen/teichoic acid export membrane protein